MVLTTFALASLLALIRPTALDSRPMLSTPASRCRVDVREEEDWQAVHILNAAPQRVYTQG
jgi:hypothetical protein